MTEAYADDLSVADIAVGDSGPELSVDNLEREDFVRYAGASGDFNPIHYDVPHAREAGNPDVFAQGMLTAGFGAHLVADWFGLANIVAFRVRFQDRVYPGHSLTVSGEITDVDRESGAVEADLTATNGEGVTVLSGSVSAELPDT